MWKESAVLEKAGKTRRKETVKGPLQLVVAYMFSISALWDFSCLANLDVHLSQAQICSKAKLPRVEPVFISLNVRHIE
jgi:hypothetical protein